MSKKSNNDIVTILARAIIFSAILLIAACEAVFL